MYIHLYVVLIDTAVYFVRLANWKSTRALRSGTLTNWTVWVDCFFFLSRSCYFVVIVGVAIGGFFVPPAPPDLSFNLSLLFSHIAPSRYNTDLFGIRFANNKHDIYAEKSTHWIRACACLRKCFGWCSMINERTKAVMKFSKFYEHFLFNLLRWRERTQHLTANTRAVGGGNMHTHKRNSWERGTGWLSEPVMSKIITHVEWHRYQNTATAECSLSPKPLLHTQNAVYQARWQIAAFNRIAYSIYVNHVVTILNKIWSIR